MRVVLIGPSEKGGPSYGNELAGFAGVCRDRSADTSASCSLPGLHERLPRALGQGSTFTLRVPAEGPPEEDEA